MNDSNQKKLFLVLSAVTMPPMFIYFFAISLSGYGIDMYMDNVYMFILMIVCFILTWVGVKYDKIKYVAPVIALLQVLIIIPETAAFAEFGMGEQGAILIGILTLFGCPLSLPLQM